MLCNLYVEHGSWDWTELIMLVVSSFFVSMFLFVPCGRLSLSILLYGLECYSLLMSDLHSLDFVVMRFLIKLFRTENKDIIDECRSFCNFSLPTEMLETKSNRFCKKFNPLMGTGNYRARPGPSSLYQM